MILDLKIWPNAILHKTSEPVTPTEIANNTHKDLIDNMIETMYYHHGVGLAAPQVGVLKRIFVMDTGEGPIVFINPDIKALEGDIGPVQEGCLSFPGVSVETQRFPVVKVSFIDQTGANTEWTYFGMGAQCVAHEIEHLDGITMATNMSLTRKEAIKREIQKNTKKG